MRYRSAIWPWLGVFGLALAAEAVATYADGEEKDCWEEIWPDETERSAKLQAMNAALALIDAKSKEPNVPQSSRDALAKAYKRLLEMLKEGQLCPACISADGSAYPLDNPPLIKIAKRVLCPGSPGYSDPRDALPTVLIHEDGHIQHSGPWYRTYCTPFEKYCMALLGDSAPGIPAKPQSGSQAEKEMKVMCYLYRGMFMLDEGIMRVVEMRLGPYVGQPDSSEGEEEACKHWSLACTNIDAAESILEDLGWNTETGEPPADYEPAVPGADFDPEYIWDYLEEAKALKRWLEAVAAAARAEHPGEYEDEWPYPDPEED